MKNKRNLQGILFLNAKTLSALELKTS